MHCESSHEVQVITNKIVTKLILNGEVQRRSRFKIQLPHRLASELVRYTK